MANNLASLGANVTLVGKIGDDMKLYIFKKELTKRHIHTKGIFTDRQYAYYF